MKSIYESLKSGSVLISEAVNRSLKKGFAEMRKDKVARMSPYWILKETHYGTRSSITRT